MVVDDLGSFRIMPVCGKHKGLQKMDLKRLAVIWLTPLLIWTLCYFWPKLW
jgi:hypothetical protein